MFDIVKIKDVELPNNIDYGFFGRKGGFSEGIYSSLNVGFERGDLRENVIKNLESIANHFGVKKVLRTRLDHTNIVKVIKNQTDIDETETYEIGKLFTADAMVTKEKGKLISVKSADCIPAILIDAQNEVIGCAHGSWKSTKLGIFENTIDEMIKLGADIQNIKVMIGACLRQKSFEITSEFYDKFLEDDKENIKYFKKTEKDGVYLFDNVAYAINRITKKGIKDIYDTKLDTYSNPDRFFSRRKSLHTNKDDIYNKDVRFGNQITTIILK